MRVSTASVAPLSVLSLLGHTVCVASLAAQRTNVVLFVPDEMRAESMGTYGNPVTSTPNFDRLAREGTRFDNAFSTYPVCTQSRASFLTGRYTHNAGHRTLYDPLRYWEPNLLRYAKNASYDVIWYGKNDALDPDSFNSSVSVAGSLGPAPWGNNAFPPSDPLYYSFISSPPPVSVEKSGDWMNAAAAIEYLRARNASGSEKPFLIYLPLTAPHPPYGCPGPYYSQYDPNSTAVRQLTARRPPNLPNKPDYVSRIRYYRNITHWDDEEARRAQIHALYLGCISYSDAVMGTVLDALDELALADSTAVFVLSDHGDYAGDYGLVEKWPSGLEDVLLRVPFIARVPGGVQGQVAGGMVQHMDVVPTVLDIIGVPAQHVHYGVSQLPLLLGQAAPDMERVAFAEGGYGSHEPLDLEGDCADPIKAADCNASSIYYPKAYQEWHEPLTVCRSAMVRTAEFKLVRRTDPLDVDHDSELYDLRVDPYELNNVYNNASYASVRATLSELLLVWALQGDLVPMGYASPWGEYELPRGMVHGNWSDSAGAAGALRGVVRGAGKVDMPGYVASPVRLPARKLQRPF